VGDDKNLTATAGFIFRDFCTNALNFNAFRIVDMTASVTFHACATAGPALRPGSW
jgi:hypothetical protein